MSNFEADPYDDRDAAEVLKMFRNMVFNVYAEIATTMLKTISYGREW